MIMHEHMHGWPHALMLCRLASVGSLMYVKEDLILPHSITFYDLIITRARGKSGPLFHFDVHDDTRLLNDASKVAPCHYQALMNFARTLTLWLQSHGARATSSCAALQEKEDSHAGKVVDRMWYNNNKHIFPASRWDMYNPEDEAEDGDNAPAAGYSIH